MNSHLIYRVCGLCATLALSLPSFGSELPAGGGDSAPAFALRGFGTLGMARSSRDGVEYVRDLSQPDGLTRHWSGKIDSVLGVQANLALGPDSEGVVQVVSRYRYDGSFRPEVTWAFLGHAFSPGLKVRAGRLGTEFYLFSDSRLIGYANTAVRPPPDFFAPLVFSHFDGIDVAASAGVGPGLLRAKLFAGRSNETSPFSGPITWDMGSSRLSGGHVEYAVGPWQFRLGRAQVRLNESPLDALAASLFAPVFAPLPPPDVTALEPGLSTAGSLARFDSLGMVYDRGALQVQAMAGRIRFNTLAYEDSRAMYLLGSYRLGRLTPYLGYSRVKSTPNAFAGPYAPLLAALTASTHADQHTTTLGMRWDFRDNLALKAQLDLVRGAPDSVHTLRGDAVRWDGRMRVLSLTLDFAF